MPPSVYIIILSWNSPADTIECLSSLQRLDYANFRVIVVDNGSTDDTVDRLRKHFPELLIIENRKNIGFAEGNNVGIRYALKHHAEYIFILNDDTVVPSDSVSVIVHQGEQDPRIGMLGPRVASFFDHSKEFLGARIDWRRGMTFQIPYSPDNVIDADHVAGCALVVKAEVVRKIGLLDSDYFCYFEDTDWGVRCERAGYRVVTVLASVIYHKGTPDNISHMTPNLLYYYRRNQYLFMRKHAGWRRRIPFLIRYTFQCFLQFQYMARTSNAEQADAVLDGFWAGITGQYGAARAKAPVWFMRVIHFSTSWLYGLTASLHPNLKSFLESHPF